MLFTILHLGLAVISIPFAHCGSRFAQLALSTSYPVPKRDNRDHQDYRDVAEPFLRKPEGHPGIAHKPVTVVSSQARHGCLGGLGRLALPPILESCQIQWQSSPQTALRPGGGNRVAVHSELFRRWLRPSGRCRCPLVVFEDLLDSRDVEGGTDTRFRLLHNR